ncbi:MAG: lipase family protein [Mycobacteriaceae bacterium]
MAHSVVSEQCVVRFRTLGRCVLAAVLTVTAVTAVALAAPALAQPAPVTQAAPAPTDPFYDAPVDVAAFAPGTVIRSRPASVSILGFPVQAWQLVYRSNNTGGAAIAATTTLLMPSGAPSGPRPLISYQAAINSLEPECNPSRSLANGTFTEAFMIAFPLLFGWAVAVPDHEGPGSAYGAGHLAGQVVLDGARAAQGFTPAGMSGPGTQVGLWGYSGGGQATAWAAELQGAYAPDVNVVGSAEGGVPVNFADIVKTNNGSPAFGLLFSSAIGLSREYPEMNLDNLLNSQGQQLRDTISTQCVNQAIDTGSGLSFDRLTLAPDAVDTPGVRSAIAKNTLGQARPKAPVLLYHSVNDPLLPTTGADTLATEYCRQGATLTYQKSPFTDHVLVAIFSIPSVLGFRADRFAGTPASTTC